MKENLWKPEYLVDIQSIDEEHKTFFELCASLVHICEQSRKHLASRKDLIRAIFELRLYAFHHFNTEETLMVKYGYGRSLEHFTEHDKYLESLREFVAELSQLPGQKDEMANEELQKLAERLSEWATQWWGEHILEHDKHYAEHIRQSKGTASH